MIMIIIYSVSSIQSANSCIIYTICKIMYHLYNLLIPVSSMQSAKSCIIYTICKFLIEYVTFVSSSLSGFVVVVFLHFYIFFKRR